MKTLQVKKITDVTFVGIMLAKEWFKGMKYDRPVYDDDFVVCTWLNYHNGVKNNIEGKLTIAICRKKEHAELIYNVL